MTKPIETTGAPAAIGAYSQAIKVGDTVYVSGQLPIDPATGEFAGDDIKSQTKQSMENIKAILREAGGDMSNIVKTTVLVQDLGDFTGMNEVYATYFSDVSPARAAYQVAALPKQALIEIEAVAVVG